MTSPRTFAGPFQVEGPEVYTGESPYIVEWWAEVEDIPVRGNAMDSGDKDEDRRHEDAILERLEAGDHWAWCCIVVRASLGPAEGQDTLGACSFTNEKEAKESNLAGYLEQLVDEAKKEAFEDFKRIAADVDRVRERMAP